MQTTTNALQALIAAGFKFPHELGLFQHPMLTADGHNVDPRELGFTVYPTGGGCDALVLQVGEFTIMLTDDDGRFCPEAHEWPQSQIGIYQGDDRDEVAVLSGLQWLELVSEMVNSIPSDSTFDRMTQEQLSAWYVEQVGYDPMQDDPEQDLESFRADCKEYALIMRCGGLDADAYRLIEAQRKAE
ncbi:TPA: hypothetical protein L4936_001544 [Pseudomonas aeruginosa]|nr:hypothetical protein [Pseudomonas aeruginosa]HBO7218599.1 hypothetical protein [Pseudomonas aeruginosa]